MALSKEDLQAIAAMLEGVATKDDIESIRADMKKGFDRLENLIDVAAKDAAQTEKRLREHMEQPHIA